MPYESLKRDLRQLALAGRGLEELELVIAHGTSDEVRGNRRDGGIEIRARQRCSSAGSSGQLLLWTASSIVASCAWRSRNPPDAWS